jgi:Cu2+-exporting ATPase
MRVLPGEAFPADGRVLEGQTLADEALLTGESRPVPRAQGEDVIAGSHNLTAAVLVQVERTGTQTRFAQIVALMDEASSTKPQIAQLADRMARPFLIAVLLAAGGAALFWWSRDPGHALMVAVAVLVVTCPCALSLATPAAMLASAGALARSGVLVRRLQALETLATVDTVVFDKTGTLTRDAFALARVTTRGGVSQADALAWAGALARQSLHPVSRALVAAGGRRPLRRCMPRRCKRLPGRACTGGWSWAARVAPAARRSGWAPPLSVDWPGPRQMRWKSVWRMKTVGWPRSSYARTCARMPVRRSAGWPSTASRCACCLVTAPRQWPGWPTRWVSRRARGACSPQDKLAFLREAQGTRAHQVAMVGDGLNDGPGLAGAHVSFAFGKAVPLAQSQADFVVMGDQLAAVAQTVQLARRTMRIVRQNLWWAAGYNAVCVPLAVVGWLPAWLAGLGMALSSLAVVMNALRLAGRMETMETS